MKVTWGKHTENKTSHYRGKSGPSKSNRWNPREQIWNLYIYTRAQMFVLHSYYNRRWYFIPSTPCLLYKWRWLKKYSHVLLKVEADNISPPWRFQVVLFLAPWSQRKPDHFWFFSSVASTNNTGQDTSLLIHLVYTWDVRSEMVPGCQHDWNDSQPSFSFFFFFFVVPGGRQRLHSESKVYRESKRRWCHYSMAITLCNEHLLHDDKLKRRTCLLPASANVATPLH